MINQVYIHAFLDGRDVPPKSAIPFLNDVNDYFEKRVLERLLQLAEDIMQWTGITGGIG